MESKEKIDGQSWGFVGPAGWDESVRPKREYVYCVLPAQVTGDLWHMAAACILSREYGKYKNADSADQQAWEERRGDYGLWMRLVPVIVITKSATIKDLREMDAGSSEIRSLHSLVTQDDVKEEYYSASAFLKDLKEEREYGAVTFDYLQDLGLDPMVIILETNAKPKQAHTKKAMMARTSGFYDDMRAEYQALRNDESFKVPHAAQGSSYFPRFEDVLSLARAEKKTKGGELKYNIIYQRLEGKRLPNPYSHRVLDYFAATTIVAQAMQNHNHQEWSRRMKTLRERMTKYDKSAATYLKQWYKKLKPNEPLIDLQKEIDVKVTEKVDALMKQVGNEVGQNADEGANGDIARVLLYSHRDHHINSQTNSTEEIFLALRDCVREVDELNINNLSRTVDFPPLLIKGRPEVNPFEKKKYSTRIIIINTSDKTFSNKVGLQVGDDFDLYDKIKLWPNWVYPGLNPLVTAGFWAKVGQRADIFGLFGGRSGSVDVASFMGVNVFWWDAPWLEVAAREPEALRAYGLKPDDLVGWSIQEMQQGAIKPTTPEKAAEDLRPLQRVRKYSKDVPTTLDEYGLQLQREKEDAMKWKDFLKKPLVSPGTTSSMTNLTQATTFSVGTDLPMSFQSLKTETANYIGEKHNQLAQCLRCLQLATVSWAGLPELQFAVIAHDNTPQWTGMRPRTLKNWLNGQIQHHFAARPAPVAGATSPPLDIGTYRPPEGDETGPTRASSDKKHKRNPWWFVRSLPMTGEVSDRAMLWPKVDEPTYENWAYWKSIIRQNGKPAPNYIYSRDRKLVPDGEKGHLLRTFYTEYIPVPYSHVDARETFEGGLRQEKQRTDGLLLKEWEWDPNGKWRVYSDVLKDLERKRRVGEEPKGRESDEKEKEKEKESEDEREKEKEGGV